MGSFHGKLIAVEDKTFAAIVDASSNIISYTQSQKQTQPLGSSLTGAISMPVQNKRGGALKVLTCRVCDKQFTRRKFQPVCCHDCNTIYKVTQQTLSQADLQGASNNESTIEHTDNH